MAGLATGSLPLRAEGRARNPIRISCFRPTWLRRASLGTPQQAVWGGSTDMSSRHRPKAAGCGRYTMPARSRVSPRRATHMDPA